MKKALKTKRVKKTPKVQICDRMINALSIGWGFKGLRLAPYSTTRHSIWIQSPNEEGWVAHKVDGGIDPETCLNDLMDEAGISK